MDLMRQRGGDLLLPPGSPQDREGRHGKARRHFGGERRRRLERAEEGEARCGSELGRRGTGREGIGSLQRDILDLIRPILTRHVDQATKTERCERPILPRDMPIVDSLAALREGASYIPLDTIIAIVNFIIYKRS
jgi:hypothetical protein